MNLRLYLRKWEENFMERAVCNHGFFMMAPNVWNPSRKSLSRPVRLSNSSSTYVTISHPSSLDFLLIQVPDMNNLSQSDECVILNQVGRMLRMSTKDEDDLIDFQKLHEGAKNSGFGRIFRSPSLFEDLVKTILLCNSTWDKTLGMVSRLCLLQSKLEDRTVGPRALKRKRTPIPDEIRRGNFPSAKEIASLDKKFINEHCRLGYRAKSIIRIAKMVENGSLHLEELEKTDMGLEQVMKKLSPLKGKGFGPFATRTLLMCMGFYHLVPSDTETKRLLREAHGIEISSKEKLETVAQEFYKKFSPYQCLAYWFDLVQNYETKVGKLSELSQSDYYTVSGCSHINKSKEVQTKME